LFKIFQVFKKANYRNMYLATLTSQLGSVIGITAFMFYLLDRFSEQPVYATITELMYSLPTLAVFFIVGVIADKMDRQKIASNCEWISSMLSSVLLICIYIGWMPLIFAILFLRSAISKFFYPAESAIVQGILNEDEYASAAGLNQMTSSIFNLFGSAIGAFIYWNFGVYGAIIIDALSFAASAMFIRISNIPEEVRLPNGKHTIKDLNVKNVFQDFKIGFQYIINFKLLLYLIFGFFVFGIMNGAFSVLPAFILKYKLAPAFYEEAMVWSGIAVGVAILLGSFVFSMIANKVRLYLMMIFALICTGIVVSAVPFATSVPIFLVISALMGFLIPAINIAIGGWMPSLVDPKMMGRVQGWVSPLMMLSHSLTLGMIAFAFPKFVSIDGLFWMVGGCFLLVGIYYAIMIPKHVKLHQHSLKKENIVFQSELEQM
jgi:MFS transporter, DHA3 family, macrolide efflux protein